MKRQTILFWHCETIYLKIIKHNVLVASPGHTQQHPGIGYFLISLLEIFLPISSSYFAYEWRQGNGGLCFYE